MAKASRASTYPHQRTVGTWRWQWTAPHTAPTWAACRPWTPAPLSAEPPPGSSTSAHHWNTATRTTDLSGGGVESPLLFIMSCRVWTFNLLIFSVSPKSTLIPSIRLQGQSMACCMSGPKNSTCPKHRTWLSYREPRGETGVRITDSLQFSRGTNIKCGANLMMFHLISVSSGWV